MKMSDLNSESISAAERILQETEGGRFQCRVCDKSYAAKSPAIKHVAEVHGDHLQEEILNMMAEDVERSRQEARLCFWETIARSKRSLTKVVSDFEADLARRPSRSDEEDPAESAMKDGDNFLSTIEWKLARLTQATTKLRAILEIEQACKHVEAEGGSLFGAVLVHRNNIMREGLTKVHSSSSTNPVANAIRLYRAGALSDLVGGSYMGYVDELLHLSATFEDRRAEWKLIRGILDDEEND